MQHWRSGDAEAIDAVAERDRIVQTFHEHAWRWSTKRGGYGQYAYQVAETWAKVIGLWSKPLMDFGEWQSVGAMWVPVNGQESIALDALSVVLPTPPGITLTARSVPTPAGNVLDMVATVFNHGQHAWVGFLYPPQDYPQPSTSWEQVDAKTYQAAKDEAYGWGPRR